MVLISRQPTHWRMGILLARFAPPFGSDEFSIIFFGVRNDGGMIPSSPVPVPLPGRGSGAGPRSGGVLRRRLGLLGSLGSLGSLDGVQGAGGVGGRLMSIFQPVSRAARRAFCPSLPMARES